MIGSCTDINSLLFKASVALGNVQVCFCLAGINHARKLVFCEYIFCAVILGIAYFIYYIKISV